jgi:hypothetical protein
MGPGIGLLVRRRDVIKNSEKKEITIFTKVKDFFMNNKKNNLIITFVLTCVLAVIVFLIAKSQIDHKIYACVSPFLLQAIITYLLFNFVKISVNDNSKMQWFYALAMNCLFAFSSVIYVFNYSYLENTLFQIINLVFLFIIIIIMYNKIEETGDLSYFKSINMFMVVFVSAIIFFLEKDCSKKYLAKLINYYYILPLMMLRGFYELLGRKSKKLNCTPNSEV